MLRRESAAPDGVVRCSQFYESGCENCPFFGMEGERDRVADCTTPNFQSLITVMEPSSSWAAKWLHLGALRSTIPESSLRA